MIQDLRAWTMSPYSQGDFYASRFFDGWYFSQELERALPIPGIYSSWSGSP